MSRWLACLALMTVFMAAPQYSDAADEVVVETLLTGLHNPCGVAVRPSESADRYEVFVADSGAGRIVRVWSNEPKPASDVVSGFSLAELGEGGLPVGPIGLLFLDRLHLIVGASSRDGGSVSRFELADEVTPKTADEAKQQIRLASDEPTRNHVYAMARTRANDTVPDAIVLACFSNDPSGDLRKIPIRAGTLADLQPFTARGHEATGGPPAAVAIGDGGHVVVGWVGSLEAPGDSRLEFYHPVSGMRTLKLSTSLHDVLGLAYSPKSGNLYAADAAWIEPKNGGVFRIDDASEPEAAKCTAVKITDVERPSALAFGPDGALYVTAFGDVRSGTTQGVLVRITGDL